jgi:hypothetical protein
VIKSGDAGQARNATNLGGNTGGFKTFPGRGTTESPETMYYVVALISAQAGLLSFTQGSCRLEHHRSGQTSTSNEFTQFNSGVPANFQQTFDFGNVLFAGYFLCLPSLNHCNISLFGFYDVMLAHGGILLATPGL